MGTHDNSNKAEPQNQFISGFISHSGEKQQSFVTQSSQKDSGLTSGKKSTGLQNRGGSNPYQLSQQMNKNIDTERQGNVPSEKETASGMVRKVKNKMFKEESDSGNARQKIMMALIPVLFLVMVFMFRQVLWKTPDKTKAAAGDDKIITGVDNSAADEIDWKIPDQIPAKMRDPVNVEKDDTLVNEQANLPDNNNDTMNVRSILLSEDKPSVVIGDKLVYLNQTINGTKVVEIHRDYIVLEKEKKRWPQRVEEDNYKQNQKTTDPGDNK